MRLVVKYYGLQGFKITAVYHTRSKTNKDYPHAHFLMCPVSINGDIFYGNDNSYYDLAEFLKTKLRENYAFIRRNEDDYNDEDYQLYMKKRGIY